MYDKYVTFEHPEKAEETTMTAFGMKGRKAGNGSRWIRPERRLAIYMRDQFTCAYCGRECRTLAPAEFGLDHLLPCSKGGTNENTNLVTACRSCNSSRKDKDLVDFAPGGALERIANLITSQVDVKTAKAILAGHQQAADH